MTRSEIWPMVLGKARGGMVCRKVLGERYRVSSHALDQL